MKLNPDCIRDILLLVEAETDLETLIRFDSDNPPDSLSAYSSDEILYHVKQCELLGLFACDVSWFTTDDCMVSYLSPAGHQFLSDIRSDTNWSKVKGIAKNVGSESFSAIKDIASGVISTLIQSQLGQL